MNDGQSKPDAKHVWGVQECQNKQYLKKTQWQARLPMAKDLISALFFFRFWPIYAP